MNDALQNSKLVPEGLRAGSDIVPLYTGSVHYFRLPRTAWQRALESLAAMGARFVDIPVPWNVHETSPGEFDFGEDNPRLDVAGFIELAARTGLRTIVRIGPMLASELTFDGVPERVVWDEASMSRTRSGAPRLTAALPVAYPAPSHASRAFHEHAAVYLRAVAERLAPLAGEGGAVALAFVGDERRAPLLSQGASDGDHHPDALSQYRRFAKHRYGSIGPLRRVHGPAATFDTLEPPSGRVPSDPDALGPHLDWLEAQEAIAEGAFYRYRAVLERHGLAGVVKLHEQGDARAAAPVDPVRMERVANGVTFACRASASEAGRRELAFIVGRAAARARAHREPVFASRTYAGFAADMTPRTDEDDLFVAMTALAYGARAVALDAGVQRDRWIGGPIDAHGKARPSAEQWRRLFAALEETQHRELTRPAPVRIVVPRLLERLGWLASATAPFPAALLGLDASEDALEGESDPTAGALAEARAFMTTVEKLLDEKRVPYEFVSAEGAERSLGDARWTIVVCPGALDPTLTSAIAQHAFGGKAVSVGPRAPERDAHFLATSARLPTLAQTPAPQLLPRGPSTLSELIATTLTDLRIAPLAAEPEAIRTTLHVDTEGRPRALFVINATGDELVAKVSVAGAKTASDPMSGEAMKVDDGNVSVVVPARTVRLLALGPAL
ncbi:MAG TPA: beta-galactosidase [Polyangiaceae bacterium]|jgi:beta-galactosidase|nr:beta-galactosidase [Polyangiaceae bacterium]